MCTFTYLPQPGGYVVTHNRDEAVFRRAWLPALVRFEDHTLCWSREPHGGGSWMGCRDDGHTLGILNGGRELHERHPPYPVSRGMLVFRGLEAKDPVSWFLGLDPEGFEPFTLILAHPEGLEEGWWDGRLWQVERHNPLLPLLRASVPLYNAEQQERRAEWFRDFLGSDKTGPREAWDFHATPRHTDPAEDMIIERGGILKTISITQSSWAENHMEFRYLDLLDPASRISRYSF